MREFDTGFLDRVKQLWLQEEPKLTHKQICTELKVSKEVLTRLIDLLELPRRPSCIRRDRPPKPKIKRVTGPTIIPELVRIAPIIPRRTRDCQWVLNDKKPYEFCLGAVWGRTAYCEYHYHMSTGVRKPSSEPIPSNVAKLGM